MFGFIKKVFFTAMAFFSFSPSNVDSLECVSMSDQECKARPKIIDVNNNEPVFYPYSIKVNKFSGSCNNINDLYARLCVPDIIKNINVKVFNLMQRLNETRRIIWHETCKCVCKLTFVIVDIYGMKTSVDVNVKNQLTNEYVIKDLFGIPVIVIVTVINHVA